MPGNRWTVLLVKDESTEVRQIPVSPWKVQAAIGGVAFLFVALLGATLFLALGGSTRVQARQLAHENDLLRQELDGIQGQVQGMEQTLAQLSDQGERLRQLAGMAGIDPEVLEVGVGGPGLDRPEDLPIWEADRSLGEESFAVRFDLDVLERRADLLLSSMGEAADSMEMQRDRLLATPSILPAAGVVSSRYSSNRFHPILHRWAPHEGIDIHAEQGTPILAAADGTVRKAGWQTGYGYSVEIDHGFGYSTLYAHASKLLVRRGQKVTRGEVIAQVGRTGLATASHLHYEVHVTGRPVNPMDYVIRGAIP